MQKGWDRRDGDEGGGGQGGMGGLWLQREGGQGRALVKWRVVSCDQRVSNLTMAIRVHADLLSIGDTPWVGYRDIGAVVGVGNSG